MAPSGVTTSASKDLRWDLLEGQPPSGERLTVRNAFPDRRPDLKIGVDEGLRRYLLVAIPIGEPREISERPSRGLSVQSVEMNVRDGLMESFVEIACLEAAGHRALDTIAVEISEALDAGATIGRIALVQNVLAKWRQFWAGFNTGILAREVQIGLFGEIWFMLNCLTPAVGTAPAMTAWRGPLGARHDFEFVQGAIEVKTTTRLDGTHHISGLEQLLEPVNGKLLLFSLELRDEVGADDSLPKLIETVRASASEDYDAIAHFDSALYAAGYQDAFATEYGKLHLRVRSASLYEVNGDFPRLVPDRIVGGLPAAITGVSYSLAMAGAASWRVGTNSATCVDYLTAVRESLRG